jgi:hypothetical protein
MARDGTLTRHVQYEVKQGPNGAWISSDRLSGYRTSIGELDGFNPRYGFTLSRRSPTGPWAITDIDAGRVRSPATERRIHLMTTYGLAMYGAQNYLPTMVQEPGFRIIAVSPTQKGGRTLVKAEFVRSNTDINVAPVVSGAVFLSPDQYWLILEFDVVSQYADENVKTQHQRMRGSCGYATSSAGIPVLREHAVRYDPVADHVNPTVEQRHEFQLDDRANYEDTEFTLSAFGLPEPPRLKGPTSWYLWTAGGALLCLIIGACLYWLKGRFPRES